MSGMGNLHIQIFPPQSQAGTVQLEFRYLSEQLLRSKMKLQRHGLENTFFGV